MYVLERALNARWAGVLFAVFTAIAAFGIGNMAQSNAIADMIVAKKLDTQNANFRISYSSGVTYQGTIPALVE